MTAPLFYTIATHRADGEPQLLAVLRKGGATLHGRLDDTTVNIRRGACAGHFATPAQARRALTIARRVHDNHRRAILKARMALEDATCARKRDLHSKLAKLSTPSAPQLPQPGGPSDA
ncbi:hypothetical protein [Novosphingobium rosa]|uniref:hypothetical protein n=1 Tax=Novosphingobium rosa TaxID=76978 RepID=UPI0008314A3F|nr:hypothetical protein [Novosphingobium rosa]